MMQAVKKFDPEKGFSCNICNGGSKRRYKYILRSWSLVKIGTTAAQKNYFLI